MRPLQARLIAACLLLPGAAGTAAAGGVHIRYGPDAPAKLAAKDVLYYEGVLELQRNHPREFAQEHPFYTKMFADPVMLDRLLDRWEAHEQRFEYWHNCLWKVLNGYRASHLEPVGQLLGPGSGGPSDRGGTGPASGNQGSTSPTGGSGGGGGGGVHPAAVPEPSSGLLIVLGVLGSGLWMVVRNRSRRVQ